MEIIGEGYTVSRLAEMAGVSVRTLHHYDEIGLLRPAARSAAGYRLYGERDLLRLQQILFFRELDFALDDIRRILDDPAFDPLAALENHRQMLLERAARIGRLLTTIDRTISKLTENDMDDKVTDEELYAGFTAEQRERYEREVREQYDPELVAESNRRARNMSRAQWQALREEGEEVHLALAGLMDRPPDDPAVQALIGRHYAMMNQFYPVSAEIYRGLGQLYISNEEFRAFYDKVRPGLADFLQPAMAYYAEHSLT
jgi:MerR family transcriptional regulator, thiopeptide resistance regulator